MLREGVLIVEQRVGASTTIGLVHGCRVAVLGLPRVGRVLLELPRGLPPRLSELT